MPTCFPCGNKSVKHGANLNVEVEKPMQAMENLICIETLKLKNANVIASYIYIIL